MRATLTVERADGTTYEVEGHEVARCVKCKQYKRDFSHNFTTDGRFDESGGYVLCRDCDPPNPKFEAMRKEWTTGFDPVTGSIYDRLSKLEQSK